MTTNAFPTAYYGSEVSEFLAAQQGAILGAIARNGGSVEQEQIDAWVEEIQVLKLALEGIKGMVFLEFVVPRIGSRIDAVIVSGHVIFPIEFKSGAREYRNQDFNQAWDYALDLKNFHEASHQAPIIPVLVATDAAFADTALSNPHPDYVFPPLRSNSVGLGHLLRLGVEIQVGSEIDGNAWARSAYRPTPTIIEAAQSLFAGHSVEAIARTDAGAVNLRVTSHRIEEIVEEARQHSRKAIVFVTGVPGAGKTLVGLNVATKKRDQAEPTHATFLSGNGPLVAVLTAALTRGEIARLSLKGDPTRKGVVKSAVKAFIQNVHHFRDAGLADSGAPSDHVVIFDEAQRAWDLKKTSSFMRTRKKRDGFSQSEPEFLLSYMDRHVDWAVVICLVGGGQEINTGEAGISEWLDAIKSSFPSWHVYLSPELTDSEYAAGKAIESLSGQKDVTWDEGLHLKVSLRSFRAEHVSRFVKAVLDCDRGNAKELLQAISTQYPIALTRDLARAKRWIREHARGSERFGLVASSRAQRLKPHAIDVRIQVDPVYWFLSGPEDTRSSYYLEDAATEYRVQGLELDWVLVTWDADLRYTGEEWKHKFFGGKRWKSIRQEVRQKYLLNAYRVLLTRARQGMVILVPNGDPRDPTRDPGFYDATFEYLAEVGLPVLQD